MKFKSEFLIIFIILMTITSAYAETTATSNHTDYFNALQKIQHLSPGMTAIPPCSVEQKKDFLKLLNANNLNHNSPGAGKIKMYHDGGLGYQDGESVELYKGDFSNQGYTEYLLVTTGGSLQVNTVSAVYKLTGDKLTSIQFYSKVQANLKIGDPGAFYLFTADPFAYKQGNKTYLRWLNTSGDYNKAKLQVCTYLWQDQYFTLVNGNPPDCLPSSPLSSQSNTQTTYPPVDAPQSNPTNFKGTHMIKATPLN